MRFKLHIKSIEEKLEYYRNPHKWFAWYPVNVGGDDYVIFEKVFRHYPNAEIRQKEYGEFGETTLLDSYYIMHGKPKYTLITREEKNVGEQHEI